MSVDTALAALKTRLATITTPQTLKKIYDDPKEATSLGEFPCAILSLAPAVEHRWSMAANGLARHDYSATIWLFVGMRETPIGELHSRALQWPEPLAQALYASVTLGGAVLFIGDGETGGLFTYQIGPIQWGLDEQARYFGLKITLPIVEKISMPMDA